MYDTTTQNHPESHPTRTAHTGTPHIRTPRAHVILRAAAGLTLAVTLAGAAFAVEPVPNEGEGRFSPRGFKGAIGVGGMEPSENQDLDQGNGGFMALGYGIDPHATIWLTLTGSEHEQNGEGVPEDRMSDVGGAEFTLQYAFNTQNRVQPYGRIGFGVYSVEDRKTHDAMTGGGVRLGLGADYWFSRRCAVGLELVARGAEYSQGRTGKNGDFDDLEKDIDANSGGMLLTFTVQ